MSVSTDYLRGSGAILSGNKNFDDLRSKFVVFSGSLRRRWYVPVICALSVGIAVLLACLGQEAMYRSTATLYVTSSVGDSAQAAYQGSLASEQRVESYRSLVKSEAVLSGAADEVGESVDSLRSVVSASTSNETVLLYVSADDAVPARSSEIANAVSKGLVRYVETLETPAAGGAPLAKLTLVSPAKVPTSPVSPRTFRDTALGIVVGLLLGLAGVLVSSRVSTVVRSSTELEDLGHGSVLGLIPEDARIADGSSLVDFSQGWSVATESFRKLRTNLLYATFDIDNPIVVVTSALPAEGKSSTVLNLAVSMAEAGQSVVVVDADLKKPQIGHRLGLSQSVGLSTCLLDGSEFGDACQRAEGAGFDVLVSGPVPPNSSELLASVRLKAGLCQLSSLYDFVLIDCAPILPVADSLLVVGAADAVVVVARSGKSKTGQLEACVKSMSFASARMLGFVLNRVVSSKESGYVYKSYSYS